jgi:hypothetical protein
MTQREIGIAVLMVLAVVACPLLAVRSQQLNVALTVLAIILGPILAIQAQKLIESAHQKREEKRRLFTTLMSTRGRTMSLEHVQALNLIDVVFSDSKDRSVTEAWAELNDHFGNYPKAPTPPATGELPEAQKLKYESEQKEPTRLRVLVKWKWIKGLFSEGWQRYFWGFGISQ